MCEAIITENEGWSLNDEEEEKRFEPPKDDDNQDPSVVYDLVLKFFYPEGRFLSREILDENLYAPDSPYVLDDRFPAEFYLLAGQLYEQVYGPTLTSCRLLQLGYELHPQSNKLQMECLLQQLYRLKCLVFRDLTQPIAEFRAQANPLESVFANSRGELMARTLIYDAYEIYEKLGLKIMYKDDLLNLLSKANLNMFVNMFERVCLSDKIFVDEKGSMNMITHIDQIFYMEGFELELEERVIQLLSPQLFDVLRNTVEKLASSDEYLLVARIAKSLRIASYILSAGDERLLALIEDYRLQLMNVCDICEVLNNLMITKPVNELFEKCFRSSNSDRKEYGVQCIKLIINNNLIGRRRNGQVAAPEHRSFSQEKVFDTLNLDQLADLNKLLKPPFIYFFRNEESYEEETSRILIETYIDFNRFKEVKQFIKVKRNSISIKNYDLIIATAVERQLRQSRNLNQIDEMVRKIFDLYDDIRRLFPNEQNPKKMFVNTNRKRNLLKIIAIIKNWNIDIRSISFEKVLEVQDSKQCNQVLSRFYRHIKSDLTTLLEVPFVKIKRKLVKSGNFSHSYECSDDELNPLIFDSEFCTFLISMASIYIQHQQIEKTQLLFDLLSENTKDTEVLAKISVQILQNPTLKFSNIGEFSKQTYLKKGLQMTKNANTLCSLVQVIKATNEKQGDISNTFEEIKDSSRNRWLFLNGQIVQEIRVKNQMVFLQVHSEGSFLNVFLELLSQKEYDQAFNLLKVSPIVEKFESIFQKLLESQLMDQSILLQMYLKCRIYRLRMEGFQIMQSVYPDIQLKDFKSIKLFQSFNLNQEQFLKQIDHPSLQIYVSSLLLFGTLTRIPVDSLEIFLRESKIYTQVSRIKSYEKKKPKEIDRQNYARTILEFAQGNASASQIVAKLFGDPQACSLLDCAIQILFSNKIMSRTQLILLQGFIRQNICSFISYPETEILQPNWNVVLIWVCSKLGIMNVEPEHPKKALQQIVDHSNIFLLTEVMAQLDNENWRADMILLYFQKLCCRVINTPENQEFDLKIMKNWIQQCPDQWKVQHLKEQIAKFVDQNDDKNLRVLKELIPL